MKSASGSPAAGHVPSGARSLEDEVAKAYQQSAEYAMVLDVLGELAGFRSEAEVVERVLQIAQSLFAPASLLYCALDHGRVARSWRIPDAPGKKLKLDADCSAPDSDYAILEDQAGFVVRVRHGTRSLGLLQVQGVSFPEYLPRYLNTAQTIANVCGLAVANSRAYLELIEKSEALETANRELRNEVAQRTRVEADLVRAKEAAEAATEAKSQFLANMSHEIRTPMNGILGMLSLLEDANLNPDGRTYLTLAQESATALLRVIDEILDFSKIEAGGLELREAPFDLRRAMQGMIEPFRPKAQERGIHLGVRVDSDVPAVLIGDWDRLRQVLLNLVDNALKFTKRGSVNVRVSREAAESGGCALLFSVSDTGIGIPEDRMDCLFQSFRQVDGSASRKYGGTGLGLAIAKRIVEALGGSIWAESADAVGSTFSFAIRFGTRPAATPAPPVRGEGTDSPVPRSADRSGSGKHEVMRADPPARILLAEDNSINRMFARALLEKRGWDVVAVADGREALNAWEEGHFDLILMDVQMPEVDGFDATRAIRSAEGARSAHIPIIGVTAHAMEGDREKCLEAGMDDYLAKPLDAERLCETVSRWLRGSSGTGIEDATPPVDLTKLIQGTDGDLGLVRTLIQTYVETYPSLLGELGEAIKNRDRHKVASASHHLRGAVSLFAADKAGSLAAELEGMASGSEFDRMDDILGDLILELDRVREHLLRV